MFLDRDVDTPGHGKDVVDGFNAVHKRYLVTFLRMCSTPEKECYTLSNKWLSIVSGQH